MEYKLHNGSGVITKPGLEKVWALRIKKRLCQRFDTTSFLFLLIPLISRLTPHQCFQYKRY